MRAFVPLVFCLLALLGIAYPNQSRSSSPARWPLEMHSGKTMGSTFAVTWRSATRHADIPHAVDASLTRINHLMSTYDPRSELSRFNQNRGTDWFSVSQETAEVVSLSQEISELSAGGFDVTVKPLVASWGFGAGASKSVPNEQELDALRARVGYEKLAVRLTPPALRKSHPELEVDLSAIAPGYAVDKIVELLERVGIVDYLVDVGGELRMAGQKAPGVRWRVGIEMPDAVERKAAASYELDTTALATSGDYRNYYELNGKRISHTIDPRTRHPIEHNLASITVLAPTAARADALATALNVLGPIRGFELAVQNGLSVFLLIRSSDGSFEHRATGLFALPH